MFDSLLGRKFSAKCKHAIKCIGTRVQLIRRKKQAMLNFLRKDVADLLLGGHESVALGRMDGLIAHINHISCYDMIEKFCECILKDLSCLQKQRECPPELREAVSTLIFAAARFSDLPELCDLRSVFTTQYGSAMESSVNPEFADKLASKSFSKARKLLLMQDIAQEFSVRWDSEAFEHKMSNPRQPAPDQPKKVGHLTNDKDNGRNGIAINGDNQEVSSHRRREPPVVVTTGRQVETEAKDIHVVSRPNNGYSHPPEPTEKTKKVLADEPKNMKASDIDATVPHVRPRGSRNETPPNDRHDLSAAYNRSAKTGEGLHFIGQEREVVGQLKSRNDNEAINMDPPYVKVKMNKNGPVTEDSGKKDASHKRTLRAQEGLDPIVQERGVDGLLKSDDDNGAKNMVPPYTTPRGKKYGADAEYWQKNGVANKTSSRAQEELDFIGHEGEAVEQLKSREGHKASSNMVPPYIRPKKNKDGTSAEDWYKNDVAYDKSSRTQQGSDSTIQGKQVAGPLKSQGDRAVNMIPPYVRPKVGKMDTKSSDQPIHENGIHEHAAGDRTNDDRHKDLSNDELVVDGKPRPRSVRRKHVKPSPVQLIYASLDGDEPVEPVAQIPSGRRRHSSERSTPAIDDDYDEEEKAVDRLLIHYSKIGMADQSGRPRTRTRAPSSTDHVVHDGEARLHQTNGRHHSNKVESVHPPERATSLPPDPISPKEKVKGPARAASMQPDPLSPQGGCVHPRLPDYDDLAARFFALRQG